MDNKETKTTGAEKTAGTEKTAGAAHHAPALAAPIVVKDTKKKSKKRRYSRGLRTVQDVERGISQSLRTVSKGLARAFNVYSKRSTKSARKKRDGAIRDGIENFTKALSKGIRVAADAPYDLVKEVNRGKVSKQLRDTARLVTPPPLR